MFISLHTNVDPDAKALQELLILDITCEAIKNWISIIPLKFYLELLQYVIRPVMRK